MKSYTNLKQSKKLAEILPIESADLWWNETKKYPEFIKTYHEYLSVSIPPIPCWSLAALLGVIPKHIKNTNTLRIDIDEKDFSIWYDEVGCGVNTELPDITMESAVDACYAMIIKLNEQNLL
jgi:hypothetical protein